MTSYPDIRPVPTSIPRPPYVPANFFDASWGEHDPVEMDESSHLARGIQMGGVDEAKIKRVARMAAEVLTEIGRLVKVSVKAYDYVFAVLTSISLESRRMN